MPLKYSIIIPAYNEEKLVQRAIKAAIGQRYPRDQFEILLVDNASTDATAQKGKEAGADRIIEYAGKQGVGSVRNAGVEQAHGEFLAFVDSDSYPETDWLSKLDRQYQNPKVVAVAGLGWPDQAMVSQKAMFRAYDWFLKTNALFGPVLPWGYNLSVRKDAFQSIGGFDPHLRTCEDWDLAMRLQKKFGKRSVVYDSSLIAYTSTRKQSQPGVLTKYIGDGVKNYVNVVILKRQNAATAMFNVR